MPAADEAFRLADVLRMSARWLTIGDGSPTPRQPVRPSEARLLAHYRQLDEPRRSILLHAATDLISTQ